MDNPELVVHAARVIDGTGQVLMGRFIAVSAGRFQAISPAPAKGAKTIDATGHTVIPGLIDTHVHLFDFLSTRNEEDMARFLESGIQARLNAFLAHGVTTIRSCGDAEDEILLVRARIESGELAGPRLLAVGPGLTSPDGHPASTVYGGNPWYRPRGAGEMDTQDHAREHVRRLADKKVDAIKLLYEGGCACEEPYIHSLAGRSEQIFRLDIAVMDAAMDEAHRHNLRVTVHTIQEERALTAIERGADGLEHGVHRMHVTNERLLSLARERGVTIAPTMTIMRDPEAYANVRRFHDAGIGLALGTDTCELAPRWGEMSIDEIGAFVQAGLSPAQALHAATLGAAIHVGRRSDLGSIEAGKAADLVILDGNPLDDISALRRVITVVKNGKVVFDRAPSLKV